MGVLECTVPYHTVLYSPKAGPGPKDKDPPVVDQVGQAQPKAKDGHHQNKGKWRRDAAGLEK